ncbi:hypothetical protein [Chloroflexus sp.]|uniref:hypothetical protein n=1 Tax=Chloroflexus sp. TaxID=1904827 RepID=UPI002ACEAB1E|nr:hypothetical protein [Chloroflexus sp.]
MMTYRRFIHIVLTGCTGIAVTLFLWVALSRLSYPFAIEWLEGNSFLHVLRVLQGQPLYVAPSYDFIPMIYTPLYYYFLCRLRRICWRWLNGKPIFMVLR